MANDIQLSPSSGGALVASDYQTFEMAKENDSILGGDDIAQIRSYAAYARAQAQAIHKTIAATSGIEDVAAIKQEALETEQTFAKVGLYADQRIGEILRELPKGHGNQYTSASVTTVTTPTKREAEKQAGVSHKTAIDLQAMAANPDVVQAVLDKAEADGRVASRKQVLDAIRERKQAEQERDEAEHDAAELRGKLSDLRDEVAALEKQNDELYELAQQQQVVEREVVREVVPDDYADIKRHVRELESANRMHGDENANLRRQLEEAQRAADGNDALGEAKSELAAFVWKYRNLDELTDVIAAAEKYLGIA